MNFETIAQILALLGDAAAIVAVLVKAFSMAVDAIDKIKKWKKTEA